MPWTIPKPLVALCLSLAIDVNLAAQTAGPSESSLHAVGIKTIKAIATGEADYLISIVDPQGIIVGNDEQKLSAASFRTDLKNHVGAYCQLFDRGCKEDNNPNGTLGHSFNSVGDPLNADLKFKVAGDRGTLEYSEAGGQGDLVATLTYRFAGGKWYLNNIHFV